MDFTTDQDELDARKVTSVKARTQSEPRVLLRKQRLAALRRVAGIWANRIDIPADGLAYERELRNEWR